MPFVDQYRQLRWTTSTDIGAAYWYTSDSEDNKIQHLENCENTGYENGDQTTHSWRTSKRSVAADPLEESGFFTQSSGSEFGFLQELNQRNKDDPSRLSRGGATYDTGHEFQTTLREVTYLTNSGAYRKGIGSNQNEYYTGLFELIFPGTLPFDARFPGITPYSADQVNLDGASAVRRTIPNDPIAGLAQFMGELHEGLPHLPIVAGKIQRLKSEKLGSEYLNYQFGIRPFQSDLTKMAQSVGKVSKLLRQLDRDEGLTIRRQAQLQDESTVEELPILNGVSIYMPRRNGQGNQAQMFHDYGLPGGGAHVTKITRSQTWFAGAYSYFLADVDNLVGRLHEFEQKANYLLGTEITLETIWQLTPWSWLFDWFSSIGNILHNATALTSDTTVLRYGYLMHQTDASLEYRLSGLVPYPYDFQGHPTPENYFPTSVAVKYSIRSKQRHRATPYGFGVDLGALSPSRIAILAALGLTRAPGILRNIP